MRVSLLAARENAAPGNQAEREEAAEPPERWIAVQGGVVGICGVDVTGYDQARPVGAGDALRCRPSAG